MSTNHFGTLQESTLPAPEPPESSDVLARAADVDDDVLELPTSDEDRDDVPNYVGAITHNGEDWLLPGFGDQGDDCGQFKPHAVCDECGHVEMSKRFCDRRLCPRCWGRWANRASVNATTRLQSYRYGQSDDYRRQWAHGIVSVDTDDVSTKRELFAKRTDVADMAMEKGFRGCAVIPHPWRASDLGKMLWRAEVDRDDDGEPIIGFWVWLRHNSERLELDEMVNWEPHYHIIGPTSPDMEGAKESDKWRYHVIKFNEESLTHTADQDSHEEVFSTFRYLYSHVGEPPECDRQMTTWHGELANNVFVDDAKESWQVEKPSEGVVDSIERNVKEMSGQCIERDESDGDGDESDDVGDCPKGDCCGNLIGVWDVDDYLDQNNPPPDVLNKMRVCRDWVEGVVTPPAGMKQPTVEKDARHALARML